jgi:uncharacterized membrane protein
MGNKFSDFLSRYSGAIIGMLIAVVLIALGIIKIVVFIAILIVFGFLGDYIQRNKVSVKEKLKSFIDRF